MQIVEIEQRSEEWHELRKGKITGTGLGEIWSARAYTRKDITDMLDMTGVEYSKKFTLAELEDKLPDDARIQLLKNAPRKLGFYKLIADQLSLDRDDENRMDRGLRLEVDAREWFEATYNKKVEEVGMCLSDVDPRIANSPDGLIRKSPKSKKFTEAIEIKCLSPERHIQAIVENQVPEEFWAQKMQYFVVNPDLEKLYFVFHDPGIAAIPFHVVEVTREELGDWPERLLQFQIAQLELIEEIVEKISF